MTRGMRGPTQLPPKLIHIFGQLTSIYNVTPNSNNGPVDGADVLSGWLGGPGRQWAPPEKKRGVRAAEGFFQGAQVRGLRDGVAGDGRAGEVQLVQRWRA